MKKIVSVVMILCMTLALAACGGKEQTVSYRSEQVESGVSIVDTWTFEAKGDKIVKLTQTNELDMSTIDEAMQAQVIAVYEAIIDQCASIEGVECTGTAGTDSYTITMVVDTTGDAVETLASLDLIAIEGNGNRLSLKATVEGLEASGYTKVEE